MLPIDSLGSLPFLLVSGCGINLQSGLGLLLLGLGTGCEHLLRRIVVSILPN